MADRYTQFTQSPPGRFVSKRLGLPQPTPLRRYEPGQSVLDGPVLLGAAPGGRLIAPAAGVISHFSGDAYVNVRGEAQNEATRGGLDTDVWDSAAEADTIFHALVFDASGIKSSDELRELHAFFRPSIRNLGASGRLLVVGTPPEQSESPRHAIAQRALEGFTRSAAKEIGGKGATAQLVYVAPEAEHAIESTLRFLLSARSAYLDGQVIRIGAGEATAPADWEKPLAGKVALVTGASRGIGAAIAEVLARDGAHVVVNDIPQQGEALTKVANRIDGSTLQLDITEETAPRSIVDHLRERHGGVDVFVHNAGVTRDKTVGRMDQELWDMVLNINLVAQERINEALLEGDTLRPGGRIVSVSSVSGIAGNRGQTNYATSKAGVIGTVDALAPVLAPRNATINAVAPGFIETQMTEAMPLATREVGRRANSLVQGGQPVDVAETIAWFASPGSGGVNGQVVKVDGQGLLGA